MCIFSVSSFCSCSHAGMYFSHLLHELDAFELLYIVSHKDCDGCFIDKQHFFSYGKTPVDFNESLYEEK